MRTEHKEQNLPWDVHGATPYYLLSGPSETRRTIWLIPTFLPCDTILSNSQHLVCAEFFDTGCSWYSWSLWRMRRAVEGGGVHRMLSHQDNLHPLNQALRGCGELQSTPRLTDESWIAFFEKFVPAFE